MKFDEQLAAYLYQYREITLEGIGTFNLDENVKVPTDHDKEVYYPIEGLTYTYNARSKTDEEVIFFLVKKLRKIEPLIRSDIESYLENMKVLLNIGNPYTIKGIGTLNKNNQGQLEFTPGDFFPEKEELNPKRENAEHNYPVRSKSPVGKVLVTILIIAASVAALGGIGWGILNFTSHQNAATDESDLQNQTAVQTVASDTVVQARDTSRLSQSKSSVSSSVPVNSNNAITADSATYKMIFEITKSKERAKSRTAQLNDLRSYTRYDSIPVNDSEAYYRLFLPMKVALKDTTHVKDSLRTFFGKRIFLVRQ